ncbi:MAG: LamG domain-containing protein [Planctomycetes bacterium]|nr:LamG domain-containing protein [Planctomycetota bacterium]
MRVLFVILSLLIFGASGKAGAQDDAGCKLRKHLRGTMWQWDGSGGEVVRFVDNGYVKHEGWTRRKLITRWDVIDRRTVLLRIERGRNHDLYALLMFNDEITAYDGFNFHGGSRLKTSIKLHMEDETRKQQAQIYVPTLDRTELSTESLTHGLVAFYPFNGNVNDESDNANHGTVHGAVLTEDRFGNIDSAYSFDGSSYINVPNSTSLQSPSNEYSIAVWTRTRKWNSYGLNSLACKGLDGAQYRPQFSNAGRFLLQDYAVVYTNFKANLGEWYFIVTVWSENIASVYVNGSKIGGTHGCRSVVVNDDPLQIGRDQPGALDYMIGEIDDIRIYNRPLSQEEIVILKELDD